MRIKKMKGGLAMLWTIVAAILSAAGFVFQNKYLYIGCGLISFISFLFQMNRDFALDNEAGYADLREDYPTNGEAIIRRERRINFTRRIAIMLLVTGIFSWLFTWHFIMATGILYGFWLLPRFFKSSVIPQMNAPESK